MRVKCDARRQAIIDAAGQVFQETGFEAATMSQICARVGGSKATLYSYFDSKEALFVEVVRQFAETHMCHIFDMLQATPDMDLPTVLQRFGEEILTVWCLPNVVNACRNVYSEAGKSPIGRLFYEKGPLQGLQETAHFLQVCMELGKLNAADSFVAAQHLHSLLKAECGESLLLGVHDCPAPEELSRQVARAVMVFLRGYASAP